MHTAPLVLFTAALALSACVAVPGRARQSLAPSAEDGVVVNTDRRPDEALSVVVRAMVAAGVPVDPVTAGARRLQARPWTIAGDTTLSVDASVIETESPQAPTVVVLSATWSSSSARVRRRLVTSRDAPRQWAAFQRLGVSVRALLQP